MIEDLKQVRDWIKEEVVPFLYTKSFENTNAGLNAECLGAYSVSVLTTLDRLIADHIPDASKMVVPDGYKLVPIEPTEEMIVAFAEKWYSHKQAIDDPYMDEAYKAMLSAAPQPTT